MLIGILNDAVVFYIIYIVLQYFNKGYLAFFDPETLHLSVIGISVIVSSIITRKYSKKELKPLRYLSKHFNAYILTFGFISLYSLMYKDLFPSRFLLVGTVTIGFIVQLLILYFRKNIVLHTIYLTGIKVNYFILFYDAVLLIFFLWLFKFIDLLNALTGFRKSILLIALILNWFVTHFVAHRFNSLEDGNNYWVFIWNHIKGNIIFISLISFTVSMTVNINSDMMKLITISIYYSIANIIVNSIYFIIKEPGKTDEVNVTLTKATDAAIEPMMTKNGHDAEIHSLQNNYVTHYLSEQLANIYLKNFPNILKFIESSVDLFSFDLRKCVVIRSSDTYNVDVLPDDSIEFYLNLHEINDIRRINNYFIRLNQILKLNCIYIGKVETIVLRRNSFYKKYPFYIARVFYFLDFLWKRVIPKLPYLKRVYFGLTKGKNRVLSLPETIGRLMYCGFEIVKLEEIDGFIYFIAKKVKNPSTDPNPSYGPFIKLNRVGLHGNIIPIYKFRTMYPYSEYLQNYAYNMLGSTDGYKINNDFRVTSWGKFIRKYWLDELPQWINFFKGDLKIFGCRPTSKAKFALYPEEFQKIMIKHKPGLIPPYYYEVPKNFTDFIECERRYFEAYDKAPFRTDLRYTIKSLYNIFIKGVRSS